MLQEDFAHDLDAARRLGGDVAVDDPARRAIPRCLPGQQHEVAGDPRVGIRAVWGGNRHGMWKVPSVTVTDDPPTLLLTTRPFSLSASTSRIDGRPISNPCSTTHRSVPPGRE